MKILQDTREQSPLSFDFPYVTKVIKSKLDCGDYGAIFENGYWPKVFFERKSLADTYGTLGKGHDRFKRELERAKNLNIRLILIIECSFTKVLKGYERSSISGETMIKMLMTMFLKHNLYLVFCKDREEAARYIYEFYSAIGRMQAK